MARKVWFQLVNAATRAAYANTTADSVRLTEEAADVADLRDAVFAKVMRTLPVNVITASLRVYANRATYDDENGRPLDEDTLIGTLGASKKDALIVEVPRQERGERDVYLFKDGINPQVPHLAREELLRCVYTMMHHRFILFMSPAASGKTSLLSLFARKYPGMNCIFASFLEPDMSAADLLRSCGIDLTARTADFSEDQQHVIMLDDVQAKYDETGFWNALIKGTPLWLPANVRFIICATHALEGGVESPVEFQPLPKFVREDFLLSDEEARKFLALPLPLGLPDKMKEQNFMELVVRECNGLIGALRVSVDAVVAHFTKRPAASETELVSYFLSQDFLHQMSRCFGSKHMTPTSLELRQFLIDCLVAAPNDLYLKPNLTDEENRCLVTLKKTGILVKEAEQHVKFSSPLAEKYYSQWLFPTRAGANPSSLRELITRVIGSMSARVLRQSAVDGTNFPKKATFQHLFMEGLALNTSAKCSICPELSRVFPSHQTTGGGQPQKIKGEIDFYLNGDLRWGLELLVNGDKIGELMRRFTPGGKYVALDMKDYSIIDLRGNETGEPTGVNRDKNRVSVFFQQGNYSSCKCVFGTDEVIYEIPLKG
ncbi:Hypothetical protein PHPALM_36979 [Phytophthora palmivora]|uniref:Crinkler (CRN) family protein n=1 Tax=Phytophthora palmivora TaxID=4796 RepID=A0A2P4WYK0_9STRA|nr:Hypothetical protein PHPALM_36979 [Phytophthora palmivora]